MERQTGGMLRALHLPMPAARRGLTLCTAVAATLATPALPYAAAAPAGTLAGCPKATVKVSRTWELEKALKAAGAGDTIVLANGTYSGRFTLKRSGRPGAPLRICGGRGAVLKGTSISKGYT